MRLRITEKVDSHHTNPDYKCIIVEFLRSDKNIRIRSLRRTEVLLDWLPTDEELFKLFQTSMDISPTFKNMVEDHFNVRT